MNRSPQPDADLERRLRRHYERTATPEPDLDQLWARLAPQLGAQEETAARPGHLLSDGRSPRETTLAPLPRQPQRRSRRLVKACIALAAMLLITLLTAALLASRHGTDNTINKPPATAPWSLYFSDASTLQTDAVDANGHLRWRYQSKSQRTLPPLLVADGVAYSATIDGQIIALNGTDGSVLWSKQLSLNTAHTLRVAQVADGIVYASADIGAPSDPPEVRSIYALDAKTGKLLWTFPQADRVLAVVDGVLYVYQATTYDDSTVQVFALNARDGSIRWQAQMAGSNSSVGEARLADGQMYFAVYGGTSTDNTMTLYALQASDGSTRWHITQHGLLTVAALLAAQGLVYLLEYDANQVSGNETLLALDATTGQQRWQQGGLAGSDRSPLPGTGPYYQNGVIYAAGADTGVEALRASDGAVLWRSQQDSGQRDEPLALDNGALYVWQSTFVNGQPQTNNHLIALNLGDGSRRWQYDVPSAIQAITLHDGVIYGAWAALPAGSHIPHGQTFALNTSDGSLRWTFDDQQIALTWLVTG